MDSVFFFFFPAQYYPLLRESFWTIIFNNSSTSGKFQKRVKPCKKYLCTTEWFIKEVLLNEICNGVRKAGKKGKRPRSDFRKSARLSLFHQGTLDNTLNLKICSNWRQGAKFANTASSFIVTSVERLGEGGLIVISKAFRDTFNAGKAFAVFLVYCWWYCWNVDIIQRILCLVIFFSMK